MKSSSKIILYLIIIVFIFVVSYERYYLVSDIINNAKTSILSGIKTVRVTEDKVNIEDKDITMVVSMPVIHYKDKE
ncbi:MAG: hypothetical protein ACRCX2_00620, partial [Paraclostridium sp.]